MEVNKAAPLPLEFPHGGIFFIKKSPIYGRQDRGISPTGAMDMFAFDTGNVMLSNPPDSPAVEIILSPAVRFTSGVYFVLTGAPCRGTFLESCSEKIPVNHASVYFARTGDILHIGQRERGFRTYLSVKESLTTDPQSFMTERGRGGHSGIFSWMDSNGYIRVIPGPEYACMSAPEDFFSRMWRVTEDSDSMGLRLSSGGSPVHSVLSEIISDPVADGTIQLTPSGPVILHRERQTMGGYPRILSVITPDMDILAQFMPGEYLKFRMITIGEARKVAAERSAALDTLRQMFR